MTGGKILCFLSTLVVALAATGQTELRTEAQTTASSGDHSPLWLNSNKYGLSSVRPNNGFLRAGLFRSMERDTAHCWAWAAGADVALAYDFTSTAVIHQAFGELRWGAALLTVGSKEQPLELKSQELSSGSQTMGINARPMPGVRLSLPEYWDIPGTGGFLGVKGHIFYGRQTDDRWQRHFVKNDNSYTEKTLFHTKAGYLRFGRTGKPLTVEAGLEMGCQFGGYSYMWDEISNGMTYAANEGGLKGMLRAFVPGGNETTEDGTAYENAQGNHLGSWLLRVNYDRDEWGVSLYADHFFEDQSSMFFLDYNGYGSGEEWNERKHSKFFLYDLRDIMLGVELRIKKQGWIESAVMEYLYTKYQSGPIYHDHTKSMPEHIGGDDNYYNHNIFSGWQHWGQVMGNPLYRSPLYNSDGLIMVENNRFWAWHIGLLGHPVDGLGYRVLCSWQRGFGTYYTPLVAPQRNTSILAEVDYSFGNKSGLEGWAVRGAFGMDHGSLLGNTVGLQLTLSRRLLLN